MSSMESFHEVLSSSVKSFPKIPADWKTSWSTFPSSDGNLRLFSLIHYRQGLKESVDGAPVRILFIIHGQGEHCGRYLHFPYYLKECVDVVATMDHRGHGRSEGVRGHVDSFEQYVDDVQVFVDQVSKEWSSSGREVQIHLLGHSMGGLISLRLLQKYENLQFRSATLSAPLLGLKFEVPLIKKITGHALSRLLGGFQLDTGLDAKLISHDERVVEAYRSDHLVHGKATARFFTEMLSAIKTARSKKQLLVPTLFLVPLKDGMVSSQFTLDFADQLIQKDKLVVTYEDFFHESFNELEKEKAFSDLSTWIIKHS